MLDLHCHSTCSDGTFTPEAVAELGRDFSVFALTDHDNCDGGARFLAATRQQRGVRLAGTELSVEPGEGYHKFHLLGLGIDPESASFAAYLERIRAGRNERNERILQRLAQLGMPLTLADVAQFAHGKTVARPHFANALVARGYASSVLDAFERFLGDGKPAYCERFRPQPGEAIAQIHAAGGVAVMAHPRFWTEDPRALRRGLRELRAQGLDGIEAVYQINRPDETIDHLRAAKELGLVVTAGSDFHGANKSNTLGMQVDNEAEFIAPFLARLAEIRRGRG